MITVSIFMVAFFAAMGGVTALADARLRRRRGRPGPSSRHRWAPPAGPDERWLRPAPARRPPVSDGQVLVAEAEEWLRQQYQP